ncbi:MAG TPA: neutral zinc metallopeptidase [Streptosporangiaceae bacterium]|jgi:hypothetical protein
MGGYGPPPQWRPPPRRKSSALAWVLGGLGVLALFGVGFVLLIVMLAGSSSHNPSIAESSTPEDTYSDTYSPTYATDTPTDSYTTPEESYSPTDTYSSDSPSSTPSPTHTTNTSRTKNAVYRAGALPTTSCRTGAESLSSSSAIRTHLHHLFGCLDKAWAPELKREGIQHESPDSVLTAGSGRGPCGAYPTPGTGVPYYCSQNNTIYASTTAVTREYGRTPGFSSMALDSLFAHEYGHHIQNLTGIMSSYSDAYSTASETTKLGLSRRLELQATCFAGMFMRSVHGSYPVSPSQQNTLILFNGNIGDWRGPRTHGTPKHNGMWYKQGYDRRKAYQCNTWTIGGSYTS